MNLSNIDFYLFDISLNIETSIESSFKSFFTSFLMLDRSTTNIFSYYRVIYIEESRNIGIYLEKLIPRHIATYRSREDESIRNDEKLRESGTTRFAILRWGCRLAIDQASPGAFN